jgi:transcriptional regulator with XRE-family HTH domain
MVQAAQQAGIHRATLDRWEKGRVQPYLAELTALLSVLDVSEQQKRHVLGLMDAPRAVRQIRQEVTHIAQQSGMAPMPHGGDLLRALRMRRGLSLEEAARRIQISGGTLRRWEKMEVWPSLEQLHRLCYALEAQEEEIIALTMGRFSQKPRLEKTSLDSLQERLYSGIMALEHRPGYYSLFELALLQLEADAWPLALRSEAGKQMLIQIYAYHAQRLSFRERLAEADSVAERALELMTSRLKPERFWMYPVLVSARASVFRGERPTPKRGLEILRPWHTVAQWPDMQAWLLSDMAKYIGLSGEREASLTLAEQACRVAERFGDAGELCLRRWDKASLLLQAERPREALAILEERDRMEDLPECRIEASLLRTEAYLAVDDPIQAHDWLQRALTDIDTYHIDQRPRAEKLAAQL